MNFEFLKDLRGFETVYKNCCNAEKLAMTMPDQSVATAGKSAEILAKNIYMIAHKQRIEGLKFVDILKDSTFQRFINNRDVIDAFHYIRKSRNHVAHDNEQECADTENARSALLYPCFRQPAATYAPCPPACSAAIRHFPAGTCTTPLPS